MKKLATLTLAALTILSLNGATFAGKIHSLDDIHDAEHNARKVSTPESAFTDPGQKFGGDKYTDRLLGISNKEGKKLSKLILKAEDHNKPIAQKVTKTPFNFVYMKTKFLAYNPKSK